MANLVVTEGTAAGKTFPVPRSVLLGREKGVDVPIDDIAASREHAKVFTQDGDWFVVDLGSRNGTKVNGQRVSRWQLGHGDTITIGKTTLRFDAPELPPSKPSGTTGGRPASAPPSAAASASAPPSAPSGATGGKPAGATADKAGAAAKPKGPSALDQERARLKAAASASRTAPTGRMRADDGSGIVIREQVLQFGRIDDRGGLLKDDLGQRSALFKAGVGILFLGVGALIVLGIVKALDKEVIEDPNVPEVPAAK